MGTECLIFQIGESKKARINVGRKSRIYHKIHPASIKILNHRLSVFTPEKPIFSKDNRLLSSELQYNQYSEFLEMYVKHVSEYNQYLSSGRFKKKMALLAV